MNGKNWIAGNALAIALIGGTGAALLAATVGAADQLEGAVRDQANAAALAHAGGGSVVESEASDDGDGYTVEIRRDDGSTIEVELDPNFKVVASLDGTDIANDNEDNDQDEGVTDDEASDRNTE